jgi:paraquat-inducible protein B
MSEQGPGRSDLAGVATAAVVERRSGPSIVWLIPLIAALVGGFVAWRAFSERGPAITITFKSAEGLEAGKTQIKYKDVQVGLVETVTLEPDLSGVVVQARMVKDSDHWLTEKTQFWIVKPRIAGGQVTGLGTLLSGSYIGMDPVLEGKHVHEFVGLEVAPVVTTSEAGRYFVLRSDRAGAVGVGSPVFFRQIQVGQVVSSELDPNSDFVTTRVFVRAPYDQRVRVDSRFWNASGIQASLGANGVKIDTESLVSILIGGIAFDEPHGAAAEVAAADSVFPLYENRQAADERHYTHTVAWQLYFDQSVRGLTVGAPVEFRGIPIGQVTDVRIEFDRPQNRFRIPVTIEVEPERFTSRQVSDEERRKAVDALVAAGLRAQLKTGNLLTGQLIVALDIFKDAKPAQVVWNAPLPEFPTVPTPLEEITANLTQLVERLGKLPVEQIGEDLKGSLAALRVTLQKSQNIGPALQDTLEKIDRTLTSTNALIGPDSTVNSELRRALLELSEAARALGLAAQQFQTQPNSVIFGKKGSN